MGVVDLVNKVGAYRPGMSFAQAVSQALASALIALRENKLIPTRDGFEYAELMAPFGDQPHLDRAKKLQITRLVQAQPQHVQVPTLVDQLSIRKRTRFEELAFKFNNDAANMSVEERAELEALTVELNPL